MDNSKNMEPGIRNATVQESPNKEQRKKESRPVIIAKVQTIEATDMLAVNRFLNHGLAKENGTSNEAVMKHRQERAQKLLEAVKDFVDIGQLCRVSIVLMKISSDFKAVEDARGHLQSQPAANVNRN